MPRALGVPALSPGLRGLGWESPRAGGRAGGRWWIWRCSACSSRVFWYLVMAALWLPPGCPLAAPWLNGLSW